jgi:hypothetical protein
MKKQLYLQKLMIGFSVIIGVMLGSCEQFLDNEVRGAEDLYDKYGGVIISNISDSETIERVLVKNKATEAVRDYKDAEGNPLKIKPGEAFLLVLDPEKYDLTVEYPFENTNSKQTKQFNVEWKKKVTWSVSSAPVHSPKGLLQVVNLSGKPVVSLKVDGGEKINPNNIPDNGRRSFSMDPGVYKIQVDIEKGDARYFPTPEKEIEIVAGDVTNVMVCSDGIIIGISNGGNQNNLWILNRASSDITKLEKKLGNAAAYEPFLQDKLPVNSGKVTGTYLNSGKYKARVTLLPGKVLVSPEFMLMDKDPTFLIVTNDRIEVVSGGDSDRDGFPDWWEQMYFGEDAVNDPDIPGKEADFDGDTVSNWEEFEKGTDPTSLDTDGDGLTDWEEIHGEVVNIPGRPETFPAPGTKFPPTDPLKTDTDSDGYSDFVEVRDRTDPVDPLSMPKLTMVIPWGS